MKLTKQGVRDLNAIKAPPGGRKLEMPPTPIACKHKNRREHYLGYYTQCLDCDMTFDTDWR